MSISIQQHGGRDWNVIKGQLRDLSSNKIFNFQVAISDGIAITGAEDKNFLKKMVKYEKRKGNNNIEYIKKSKIVIEKYPNRKKDDITREILIKLKKGGANITKQ